MTQKNITTLAMSDYIPDEVITNILHRLGVNDLVKCRHVSKQWIAIIDSPRFITDQLHRSQTTNSNTALFIQTINKGNGNNLLYWRLNNATEGSSSSTPIQYLNQPSKVKLMGSCNGLLCYLHFNHTHNDLVVLNPSTGERHIVNSFISIEKVAEMVRYGFGYDELSKDYKVVIITRSGVAEIHNVRNRDFTGTIPFPIRRIGCFEEKRGVFVGGVLHWIIFDMSALSYVFLALDFGLNTFRELPQPKYCFSWGKSIAVVDSCLSVCSFYKEEEEANIVGIYLMKEYGNGESWNRIYSFQDPVPESAVLESVVPVWGNGDRLLLKLDGGRKLVWFDKVEDDMVEAMNPEDGLFDAVYCLESLVKIFPVRDDADDRVLVRSTRRS